ncbi:MAG: HesA/MoeB/ThiF family protein [Bacteroidales bacterium]|jgi:adenylyltransferase/sulfurtransferase|nr:HesA/MoeB/ThiF family protein [Bacteroidales bacterium]
MERYVRQSMLPEIGEEGQRKITHASVLLVGVGGLGSVISQYLVAAGIGTLGLVDNDTVSLHNLQRQVLYREPQVGLSKALTAKQSLQKLNSEVHIEAYPHSFKPANAIGLCENYDIIIDGTDNYTTRYLMNDVCVGLDKPMIYGAISAFYGQVSVFNYRGGASYRCLYPQTEEEKTVPVGVFGMLPGIIGCLQVSETLKLITGCGEILHNKLFTIDLLNNSTSILQITPNPDERQKARERYKALSER